MLVNLNNVFESTRDVLVRTELIHKEIKNISHAKLKEKLTEVTRTCQADLLILSDILIGAMECETDSDIMNYLDLDNSYKSEKES